MFWLIIICFLVILVQSTFSAFDKTKNLWYRGPVIFSVGYFWGVIVSMLWLFFFGATGVPIY